ncbi:MAG: hypothetical protein K2H08_01330 [Duncaniella sp.]|uniref:hypothetical protein n=1 Tax=uncultured Duncaniella sp. TaxID=2768039 RepID=UPI0023CAB04F|nr:hypothetical protein [uncultured Duncaniella sp.]MDE5915974.1 hypothetical protein [Duncaniella sp.]MDE5960348.1 hypothetical protein [Duncaniella sp.]
MQNETFIRRYYPEEDITYYLHFVGEEAIRQLEIHADKRLRYTTDHPYDDDGGLYDQNFSDIEWPADSFIIRDEFEAEWDK